MDSSKVFLGIAPIAWTNDDMPELGSENTFEQCVSEMALAGFVGTEIGNKYPKDPDVLKKFLDIRGIKVCNAWYSTYFTTDLFDETVEGFIKHRDFLHKMGAKVIGCSEQGLGIQGQNKSIFDEKPVFTDDEFKKLADGMNRLAELAEEKGMKVSLHHHMGTGVQTPAEIDKFLELTNKNVYLLFDTGHIFFSEGNQQSVDDVIKKHMDRIVHIHLKDVRQSVVEEVKQKKMSFLDAVRAGAFTVPGDGSINFDTVFDIVEKSGYSGYMVVEAEQDPAVANPFEYAVMARKFIREKTGL